MKSTLSFNQLFQSRMFLLTLAVYILALGIGSYGSRGFNMTVSPLYDPIAYWSKMFWLYSWLIFIITYAVIHLFRYKTHALISKTHLVAIILEIIISERFFSSGLLETTIILTSALSFLANIIYVFTSKKRTQKST